MFYMSSRFSRDDDDDDDKVLKDGKSVRIPMMMRDAAMRGGPLGQQSGDCCTIDGREGRLRIVDGSLKCVPLKSQDAKPQFTDGRTTDPTALHRPGFRVPVVCDRRAVRDAYADYETDLVNAYRGEERSSSTDHTHDPAQNAKRSDSITLDQHRQTMDRLYRERDELDANAWRKG